MYCTRLFLLAASFAFYLNSHSQSDTSSDGDGLRVFERVEIEASYPGGESAWRKFLEKNLNPNVPVNNGAPDGRYTVWIQFVVDKEGNVSDITALTKMGYGMEEEVIRLLKNSGKWNPAYQKGKTVKAYRKQPISFIVESDDFEIKTKTPYTLFTETDNEIEVYVNKVKSEDLMLSISQGRIIPKGNGIYIVKLTKTGRVIITIFNTKKNKKIGDISFEVKEQKKQGE